MAVDPDERTARIIMSRIAEPGDVDACRLVHEHSAMAVVDRLRAGHHGSSKLADWAERVPGTHVEGLLTQAAAVEARYLCPGDDEWPGAVDDLVRLELAGPERRGGAPFGLWVRGRESAAALWVRAVAVVGARSATTYGEHVAADLALDCAERGWHVVSGGAYGIDAAAHRGCLAAERPTIAVLAGGIDRLYPAGNIALLERVVADGLLVAEAVPGCAPSRSRFLVRNRLIAALTQGTVVVEAALRSGSLNTARWARDLNRLVMGVPGPVTSAMSAGVHDLLRQPEAALVTGGPDVVELLSPVGEGLAEPRSGTSTDRDGLDLRSRQLLDAVPLHQPVPASAIAHTAGLRRDDVEKRLHALRRIGAVVREPDGWRVATTSAHPVSRNPPETTPSAP